MAFEECIVNLITDPADKQALEEGLIELSTGDVVAGRKVTTDVAKKLIKKQNAVVNRIRAQGGFALKTDINNIITPVSEQTSDTTAELPRSELEGILPGDQSRINKNRDLAEGLGFLELLHAAFTTGNTNEQIAASLLEAHNKDTLKGISNPVEFVSDVRTSLDIPNRTDKAAFQQWVSTLNNTEIELSKLMLQASIGPSTNQTKTPYDFSFLKAVEPKVKTIFFSVRNVLYRKDINKVLEAKGLNEKEIAAFKNMLTFAREVIAPNLPLKAIHRPRLFSSNILKAPVLALLGLGRQGRARSFNENFVGLIAETTFEWVGTMAESTLQKYEDDIKASFNINTEERLTKDAKETLSEVGDIQSRIVQDIGNQIFDMLGIDVDSKAIELTSPLFKQQLITSLGLIATQALVRGGLLNRIEIVPKYMGEMLGQYKDEIGANIRFLRAAHKSLEGEEFNQPSDQLATLIEQYKDPAYKSAIEKVTVGKEAAAAPYLEPLPEKKQPKTLKGNKQKLTWLASKLLKKLHKTPFRVDPEAMKVFKSVSRDAYLDSQGYVRDLSKHLKRDHLSIKGKNRALEAEYDQVLEFTDQLEDGAEFYFNYELYVNNRVGMINNIVNPQNNKLHRHLFKPSSQFEIEVPAGKSEIRQHAINAIAAAFGFSIEKYDQDGVNKEFNNLLNDPDIQEAIKEINSSKTKHTATEKILKKYGKPVVLDGLGALASYDPEGAFTTNIGTEVDATTSGLSIALLQFSNSLSEKNLKLFAAAGFHLDGTTNQRDWKKGQHHYDNYQLMLKNQVEKVEKQAHKLLPPVKKLVGTLFSGEIGTDTFEVTSEGRDSTKNATTIVNYGASLETVLEHISEDFMDKVYGYVSTGIELGINTKEGKEYFDKLQKTLNTILASDSQVDFLALSKTDEGITSFNFNKKQEAQLIGAFQVTYGNALTGAISETYKELMHARDNLGEVVGNIFILYEKIYNRAYQKAIEAKKKKLIEKGYSPDLVALSRKEEDAVVDSIKQFLPTFKIPFSRNREDGVLLLKDKKELLSDRTIPNNGKGKQTPVYSSNDLVDTKMEYETPLPAPTIYKSKDEIVEGVPTSSESIASYRYVPKAPGASALTNTMQSVESSHIQALMLAKALLGIHDAGIHAINQIIENTIYHNDQIVKINSEYNLLEEIINTYDQIAAEAAKYPSLAKELRALEKGSAEAVANLDKLIIENKAMREELLNPKDGISTVISAVYEDAASTRDSNKKTDPVQVIKQLTLDIDNNDKLGSSGTGTGNFNPTETLDSTKHTIKEIFDNLYNPESQNKTDSVSHTMHLSGLIDQIAEEVLTEADNFTVNLETRGSDPELQPGRENIGTYVNGVIDIVVSIDPVMNSLQLSAQEVMVHEHVHAISAFAIKKSTLLRQQVRKIFNAAKDQLTWEDLLTKPLDQSSELDIEAAKERYDYIFNSENGIHEFVAFGNTNEQFMAVLDKVKVDKAVNTKGLSIAGALGAWIKRALYYIGGAYLGTNKIDNAQEELAVLTMKLAKIKELNNSRLARITKTITALNPVVISAFNNYIFDPVYKYGQKEDRNIISRTARVATSLPALVRSRDFKLVTKAVLRNFDNMSLGIFNHAGRMLRKLPTEIAGANEDNWVFHTFIRKSKNHIDRERQKYKEGIVSALNENFLTEITDNDREDLYQSHLRTGMVDIRNDYTPVELQRLLTDNNYLANEIARVEALLNQFGTRNAKNYALQAKGLGRIMAGKTPGIKNPMLNPHNIAKGIYEKGFTPEGDLTVAQGIINQLKTLQALRETDTAVKKRSAEVHKREHEADNDFNGIVAFFNLHETHQEESLERLFENDPYLVRSGFHSQITDPNVDIKFSNNPRDIELRRAGYKMVDEVKKSKADKNQETTYMYVTNHGGMVSYMKTIVSLTANTVAGTTLEDMAINSGSINPIKDAAKNLEQISKRNAASINKNKMESTDNEPIPIVSSQGNIVGYRYMMNEDARVKYLKKDTRIDQVLGTMYGNLIDKQNTKKINKEVAKMLRLNYNKNILTNPGDFVEISKRSDNQEYREIYALIPDDMRADLEREFGSKEFYVNKDYIDLVFGFRKMTLANVAILQHLSGIIRYSEQIWQDVISLVKNNIVIKTTVLVNNIMSNIIVGFFYGVPPDYMIKAKVRATAALDDFLENERTITKIELRMRSDKKLSDSAKAKLQGRLNQLQKDNNDSIVKPLMDEGFMSAIVEDITVDTGTDKYGVSGILNNFLDRQVGDKFPEGIKKAYGYAYLTKDNDIYKLLLKTTQYSDFVARYAVYSHMTQVQGKSHEVALRAVADAFINYELPTSRELQYLNDMGFMVFTKYAIRIQKVLWKLAGNNPANVLSYYGLQTLTGTNPSDIFESASLLPGLDSLNNPIGLVQDNLKWWGLEHATDAVGAVNPFD